MEQSAVQCGNESGLPVVVALGLLCTTLEQQLRRCPTFLMDLAPPAVAQSASDVWSNRLLKTTPTAEHLCQIHVDGGCRVACFRYRHLVGKRRGQGFRPSGLSDTVSRAAFALSRPSFATLCRPCGKQMFSDIRPTRKGCVLASRGPQCSSITWRIRSCPQMLLSVPESTST